MAGPPTCRIATAGWSIPLQSAAAFPSIGSGLERYASRFRGVEINTTFYRSLRASTYARWAEATPAHFRFAVKLPKAITHQARLVDIGEPLTAFAEEVSALGAKLGPLLVQLPPSLPFEATVHDAFFITLRKVWTGDIALEPRHPSWFEAGPEALLITHHVSRVAADPPPHPAARRPAGWPGLAYWRLHGSPRVYYSPYEAPWLAALADQIDSGDAHETWCVFDNTASGAALANALTLQERTA